ncbi:alpha/beta hydrolase [Prochlorococcus marinus]|uniref:Alpha/beta hydrolase n=1 Tax=Prochlorococcus marinus XMU1408 TaxID=2213228 RepID=A0A318R1R9_PROMR|nr:alpha/beta hydrolase [Prochlorococcus marinus]MBW3042644.1 alpha/beta hydrolase [Prochlorococcus marinus str. XMU1408]PYE01339.1 alpha/beta hydrolase [Prochlorococcus marinus XMU1408]
MKEIIAMHGWAGDSNQWSSWEKIFKCCDWEWQAAERGYKAIIPQTPKWNHNSNQVELKRVAICHSLGSHLIDKKILHSATHLVLINSFSRFIPSGKEHRPVQMALNRMMNAINAPNESAMLRKFHIKAYKPNYIDVESIESNLLHISDAGRLRLKQDLIRLINSDSLPIGLNSYANVLIVNSEQDYILANQTKEKLAEDLINHLKVAPKIINLQDEGHFITKIKNIKKIKHWLEFDHAKNMV